MKPQLVRLTQTALVVATLAATVVNATARPGPAGKNHGRSHAQQLQKLDQQLFARVQSGCDGVKHQEVIVTAKPGYREGLRKSLHLHGDDVLGEFPSLNAVVVRV